MLRWALCCCTGSRSYRLWSSLKRGCAWRRFPTHCSRNSATTKFTTGAWLWGSLACSAPRYSWRSFGGLEPCPCLPVAAVWSRDGRPNASASPFWVTIALLACRKTSPSLCTTSVPGGAAGLSCPPATTPPGPSASNALSAAYFSRQTSSYSTRTAQGLLPSTSSPTPPISTPGGGTWSLAVHHQRRYFCFVPLIILHLNCYCYWSTCVEDSGWCLRFYGDVSDGGCILSNNNISSCRYWALQELLASIIRVIMQ